MVNKHRIIKSMKPAEAFSLLADSKRQKVLCQLYRKNGLTSVDELAFDIGSNADEDVKSAKFELVHNHLPRLEDHGAIEYDNRSGDIVLTDFGRELKSLLDTAVNLEKTLNEKKKRKHRK